MAAPVMKRPVIPVPKGVGSQPVGTTGNGWPTGSLTLGHPPGTVLKLVSGMVSYQSAAVRGVGVRWLSWPPQPRSHQLALVLT